MNSTSELRPSDNEPFGPAFWCAYVANTSLMIAVSMMFRYSDLITQLGGTEYELGWIVGIGMVGAIVVRVFQGAGIDRYGAGNVWLASNLLVLASLVAHLWITRIDTPLIYALRILYTVSLAGSFGASITFVSLKAPAHRTGEIIGSLGSSGFVGMAVGPIIVDYLFADAVDGRAAIDRMFLWASAVTAVAAMAAGAARLLAGPHTNASRRRVPMHRIIRRYHPGSVLLIGIAMGMGIGIPFYFLRPFAQQLGISGIRNFFFVYAVTAFSVRLVARQLPDRWGVRRTVLLGMAFLTADMLSFLVVRNELALMLPAVFGGIAHAFVFPAAMAGGSLAFPTRYRGIATSLMLTMFDLGNLVGQPAVGTLVWFARQWSLPAYPTMFLSVAAVMLASMAWYAWRTRDRDVDDARPIEFLGVAHCALGEGVVRTSPSDKNRPMAQDADSGGGRGRASVDAWRGPVA